MDVDDHLQIWDTEEFEIVSHIPFRFPVSDVQMPSSGSFVHKLAAVCSDIKGATLVDLFSGSHIQAVEGNVDHGSCCYWNPRYVLRNSPYHIEMSMNS